MKQLLLFGVTQQMIWVGNWHWLIEAAHLFVGVGAITLVGTIAARFLRLRKSAALSTAAVGDPARQAR